MVRPEPAFLTAFPITLPRSSTGRAHPARGHHALDDDRNALIARSTQPNVAAARAAVLRAVPSTRSSSSTSYVGRLVLMRPRLPAP